MLSRFIRLHNFFIKESVNYLGWDDYYKARYKSNEFKLAYIRFMWYSRYDILGIK